MPSPLQAEVQFDPEGHLIIPLALMQAIVVDNDKALIAKVENGRLIIEQRESVLQRLKARFANIPTNVSLADELIAERRIESRHYDWAMK